MRQTAGCYPVGRGSFKPFIKGKPCAGDPGGFTLVECIVTLSIYSIVLSLALGLYLTGYKAYKRAENQVDVQENLRISYSRILGSIRGIDAPEVQVRVVGNKLLVGSTQYYVENGVLFEHKGAGKNHLALYITDFSPSMENGYLQLHISGQKQEGDTPLSVTLLFHTGGDP